MKILHIIERLDNYGGTPVKLIALARNDYHNKHIFFLFKTPDSSHTKSFDGMEIYCHDGTFLDSIRNLNLIIRKKNIDIICTHFLRAKLLGTISGFFSSKEVFQFEHGLPRITYNKVSLKYFGGLIIENILSFFVKKYVCNSYTVRNVLKREVILSRNKVMVINNAIWLNSELNKGKIAEIRSKYAIRDGDHIILVSGGFVPARDFLVIIDSLQMLSEKYDNVKAFIIGDGPDLKKITNHLAKYEYNNIILLGYQQSLKHYMSIADIFIYPIIQTSGIGLTLLEAMYYEACVISFAMGDKRDNPIQDKVNGVLVNRTATSIYAALLYLINNPDVLKRIAHQGRFTVEECYNFSNYIKAFNEVLE